MIPRTQNITILMADDDEDDRLMTKEALEEQARFKDHLRFVEDGEELLNYLRRRDKYQDPRTSPRLALILLDLNMPRMDGRQALREIKNDPRLRGIPVVILTTSQAEEDIYRSYDLGVNSFIKKPVSFAALSEVLKSLAHYWFDTVELPADEEVV